MHLSLPSSILHQTLSVLAQGMRNQAIRATIAVQNYVNADTTASTPGGLPYQRRTVIFKNYVDSSTGVNMPLLEKIGRDTAPFTKFYEPSHPAADAQGQVLQPNINRYFEAADYQQTNLQTAGCARLYEGTSGMIYRVNDMMIKA